MLYTSLKARRAMRSHAPQSSRRLQLETLEDRVVPSHLRATSLMPGSERLTHLTGINFFTKASTSTTLSTSVTPSVLGQAVTFTATISILNLSASTPTGTVQFQIDGANAGSPVGLSTTGRQTSATFSTASLTVGTHIITASYSGDSSFAGSSGSLTQMVSSGTGAGGNVIVTLNMFTGVLGIMGDTGNNAITIQQNSPGSLQVAGVGGTLVNQSSSPASFSLGSVTEIDVFLQNGNDSVAMNNFDISGNISLSAGSGSDTFLLDTLTAKQIVIKATGPDTVSVHGVTATNGLGIIIGPGSQSVSVTDTTCLDLLIQAHSAAGDNTSFTLVNDTITDVAGGLLLSDFPGAGSDTVTLSHLTVTHELAVVLSGGVNTVSADNVTAAFGRIDGGEPDSGGNLYFDGGGNQGYFVQHFVGH